LQKWTFLKMSKFHFPFRLLEKKSEENLADFVGCNYAVKYLQTVEINESIYAAKYIIKIVGKCGNKREKRLAIIIIIIARLFPLKPKQIR